MNELLNAALYYASLGWSVIPIRPKDKKPALKWEQYQTGRASEEQIRDWWKKWPRANVGVITGGISELLSGCPTGAGKYSCKSRHYLRHYWFAVITIFKHPGGEVRNFARRLACDLRGDGGYIVAPPYSPEW